MLGFQWLQENEKMKSTTPNCIGFYVDIQMFQPFRHSRIHKSNLIKRKILYSEKVSDKCF